VKGHYAERLYRFIDEISHDWILLAKLVASAEVALTLFRKQYSILIILSSELPQEIAPPFLQKLWHKLRASGSTILFPQNTVLGACALPHCFLRHFRPKEMLHGYGCKPYLYRSFNKRTLVQPGVGIE
jgi:hypothetical protein